MVKIMVPNPMNKWMDLGGFSPFFWKYPYGSGFFSPRKLGGVVFFVPGFFFGKSKTSTSGSRWFPPLKNSKHMLGWVPFFYSDDQTLTFLNKKNG